MMKKERNILELLTLLRENIEEYWHRKDMEFPLSGLCEYIYRIYKENLITGIEKSKLLDYIELYRPDKSKYSDVHWWPLFELPPRIEFLDMLIEDWKNMSPIERMKALGLFEKDYKHDV